MCATVAKSRVTPDEFEAMPDGKSYELVDGTLVERAMGNEASWVALALGSLLMAHCRASGLGRAFGAEAGYRCFPGDPNRVRKPDLSFVRSGRLPRDRAPRGFATIAPDLVVEVVSPNDLASELDAKVEEYIAAGVRLIWLVNPETRRVRIHRLDGSITGLSENDELTGEEVVPGFRCRISEILTEPDEQDDRSS